MTISLQTSVDGSYATIDVNGSEKLRISELGNLSVTGNFAQGVNPSFRNKLINGNFDIWQRGTSQTSSGYDSDDRWVNSHGGSTKTHSRQAFTNGQTEVPNNPSFFSRTVVSSVAGAANYVVKAQRIEDVTLSSGKTFTCSFWAKADAPKNIAIEGYQGFGTGGSTAVDSINSQLIALTTSWTKYEVQLTFPSVSGKTIGVSNYFQLLFWFDAGSSFDVRSASLGQQSGTFDIAQVQLEEGTIATAFEMRPYTAELTMCKYYYEEIGATLLGYQTTVGGHVSSFISYTIAKRTASTLSLLTTSISANATSITADTGYINGFRFWATAIAAGAVQVSRIYAVSAEL